MLTAAVELAREHDDEPPLVIEQVRLARNVQ
jgi:hypothetical protein